MDGELLGGVGVGRDITDRKERERRLARQNERLEEFAGLVSHDLRNPLQVARAHLELLREETDSEHAESVGDALERMETLIDDMLALARTGQDLTEEDLDPLDLERQVVQTWSAVDCDGTLEVADDVGTVRAEAGLFSQLCENLLSNAADHGGPGVTVRVGRLEDAEGFYVADDGPGIPPADRDSVFDTGYSTASDGTGYGLAIVDHVAEAHDWDVAVAESDLGGARFEITGLDAE